MRYCEVGSGWKRDFGWIPEAFSAGDELTVVDLSTQSYGMFGATKPVPLAIEEAIETGNDSAEINIRRLEAAAKLGSFTYLLTHGNGCITDFPDEYFDALLLKNVIGDPRTDCANLLEESKRIARSIVVVEEYSPVEAYPYMDRVGWLKINPELVSAKIRVYQAIAEVWISNT